MDHCPVLGADVSSRQLLLFAESGFRIGIGEDVGNPFHQWEDLVALIATQSP